MKLTAMALSPTADAHRLTDPLRRPHTPRRPARVPRRRRPR